MKKLLGLFFICAVGCSSLQAQTKPACQKLTDAINNAKIEISNSDGMTLKNVKLSIKDCKAHYTFDMTAEGETASMEVDFSLEDIISVEKNKEEGTIHLKLYDGKEANSKMKAGGETMEEKQTEVLFKFTEAQYEKMYELLKAAVKECNDAYLDLDE